VMDVVDYPDVVLRVVGTDQYRVRTAPVLEEVIPLRPRFNGLPAAVDDDDAIAEFGSRGRRLLAKRSPEAGESVRQLRRQLQLSAVCDEDSIRRLGKDAAGRSPDVPGLRERQRLRPSLRDVVGPGAIVAAL